MPSSFPSVLLRMSADPCSLRRNPYREMCRVALPCPLTLHPARGREPSCTAEGQKCIGCKMDGHNKGSIRRCTSDNTRGSEREGRNNGRKDGRKYAQRKIRWARRVTVWPRVRQLHELRRERWSFCKRSEVGWRAVVVELLSSPRPRASSESASAASFSGGGAGALLSAAAGREGLATQVKFRTRRHAVELPRPPSLTVDEPLAPPFSASVGVGIGEARVPSPLRGCCQHLSPEKHHVPPLS